MERKYFKNQAEIYQALLDGKKVAHVYSEKNYYMLKDGFLTYIDGTMTYQSFDIPSNFYLYEEPVDETKYLWVVKGLDATIFIPDRLQTKIEAELKEGYLYPVARLNEETKKVEWL